MRVVQLRSGSDAMASYADPRGAVRRGLQVPVSELSSFIVFQVDLDRVQDPCAAMSDLPFLYEPGQLVAGHRTELAAFLGDSDPPGWRGFLVVSGMWLEPEYRGKGLGRICVQLALARLGRGYRFALNLPQPIHDHERPPSDDPDALPIDWEVPGSAGAVLLACLCLEPGNVGTKRSGRGAVPVDAGWTRGPVRDTGRFARCDVLLELGKNNQFVAERRNEFGGLRKLCPAHVGLQTIRKRLPCEVGSVPLVRWLPVEPWHLSSSRTVR